MSEDDPLSDIALFWHRRDLRISDNIGLAARQHSSRVVGVFCLDPNLLERDDVALIRRLICLAVCDRCCSGMQKREAGC